MRVLAWKLPHVFILSASVICVLIVIWHKVPPLAISNSFDHRASQGQDGDVVVAKNRRHKTILLWNSFFAKPNYGIGGLGTAVFRRTKCPRKCYLTNDRSELTRADAVVVHTYNMAPGRQNSSMPRRTSRRQIFVFFIAESPLRSRAGFDETEFGFDDTFNLTFTFLRSPMTDVYSPLGGVRRKKTPDGRGVPPSELLEKTRTVAWFVSNCRAPSARMEYAVELSRYVDVDVFGRCGNLTCEMGNRTCLSRVRSTYMFYLAFENSFCKDYLTEKVFRTLKLRLVPIVYGYADYGRVLPPKSYIDVRDYESPRKLAEHLHRLKNNRTLYGEYFEWRKYYDVLMEADYRTMGFCRLCSILHDKQYKYKSRFDPVKDYWNPDKLCLSRKEEKRVVHLIRT